MKMGTTLSGIYSLNGQKDIHERKTVQVHTIFLPDMTAVRWWSLDIWSSSNHHQT